MDVKEKIIVTIGYMDFEFSSINLAIDFARTAVNTIDRDETYGRRKVELSVIYEEDTKDEEEE